MKFPDFNLPDQNSRIRRLEEFKDRKYIVVYFYPKDNTPGCTIEAKEFTDSLDEFHNLNVEILGVSTQSPKSHTQFCTKHNLKLTLLSDNDKELTKSLGILRLIGMARRTTYLIKPDGEIIKEWRNVKPATHAKEVLDYITNLK